MGDKEGQTRTIAFRRSLLGIILLSTVVVASTGDLVSRSPAEPSKPLPMLYLVNAPPFDPLSERPLIPSRWIARDAKGYYVLQFRKTVDDGVKESLSALGVTFYGYIPYYGFIVRMNDQTKAALQNWDIVRAIVTFHPAYRVSPSLMSENPTREICCLDVHVFENLEAVRSQIEVVIERFGGEILQLEDVRKIQVAVQLETAVEVIREIAFIPDVRWIEESPRFRPLNDVAADTMTAPQVWGSPLGLTGKGQIIAIADTGLDSGVNDGSMHDDLEGRIVMISSWPVRKDMLYKNDGSDDGAADAHPNSTSFEAGHGTHVSGSALGSGQQSSNLTSPIRGIAYEAKLVFQAVEQWTHLAGLVGPPTWDYELSGVPHDLTELFSEAHSHGARIHSNSWGDVKIGEYSDSSKQVDQFVWDHPDMVILFGAGNEGVDMKPSDGEVDSGSIIAPATAKNCISVGASETKRGDAFGIAPYTTYGAAYPSEFPNEPIFSDYMSTNPDDPDELWARSSRGPTNDNRTKPDVVAPGTFILSTRSSKLNPTKDTLWGKPSDASYANLDASYIFAGGTSMATPLVAGSVALIRQYLVDEKGHTSPSAALIKAILINGATDISGGNIPDNGSGWGTVDLQGSVSETLKYDDNKPGISQDQTHEFEFDVQSSSKPLKITLVWTDYPGTENASKALVNDLDLMVVDPDGKIYYGNHLTNGWSSHITTASGFDRDNNVENVFIQTPVTGSYKIRVYGTLVPQEPQPYALVTRGLGSLTPPPPSFTIQISPHAITLPRGAATDKHTVRVYSHFGFNKAVTLSDAIDPSVPSIQIDIASPQLTPPANSFGECKLSLTTKKNTPADTYTLVVTGTSATLVSRDKAQVVVRAVDAIAVWQHEVLLPPRMEVRDWDIWYSIWDSDSASWWTPAGEKAAPIYPALPTDEFTEHDRDANIAFDRDGNAIVVWARENRPGVTSGYNIWYSRWITSGLNWGWTTPKSIQNLKGDDTDPAIAIDTDGTAIAIWVHEESGKRYIYYSLWHEEKGWGSSSPLVPSANWYGAASLPEIAFTANAAADSKYTSHQAVAIWTDTHYGATAIVDTLHYSIWNGSAWHNAAGVGKIGVIPQDAWTGWPHTDVPSQPQAGYRNGISADKTGHAWVVWTTKDTTTYVNPVDVIHYARWDGTKWDMKATSSPGQGVQPATAYDAFNNVITVYSCTGVSPPDIRYFIEAGAATGAKSTLSDRRPATAILPENCAMTVWWSDGGSESEIWYSKSGIALQNWQSGQPITITPNLRDQNPAIASPTGSPTMPPAPYP